MHEIIMRREDAIGMIEYCRSLLPAEACGVLLGTRFGEEIRIVEVRPINNVAAEANRRFELNPRDWIPLLYGEGLQEGIKAVGLFHSHPRTPALPSVNDLQTVWHSLDCFVILSFRRPEHPEIKAFRYFVCANGRSAGDLCCSCEELALTIRPSAQEA